MKNYVEAPIKLQNCSCGSRCVRCCSCHDCGEERAEHSGGYEAMIPEFRGNVNYGRRPDFWESGGLD